MAQRLTILKSFLPQDSAKVVQSITTKVLVGGGTIYCSYNMLKYLGSRYQLSFVYQKRLQEYNSCLSQTTESSIVHSPYDIDVHYSIGEEEGDLNICVPQHGAWFSDFGIDKEELKEIKQLLSEGKIQFHRTPNSLFLCIGNSELAPSLYLVDSPDGNNYASSSMNSPASKRFDLIMYATPDEAAERNLIFKSSFQNVLSHIFGIGMGIACTRLAWKSTLKKHLDNIIQNVAGTSASSKGMNTFASKIALSVAVGGTLYEVVQKVGPVWQNYQISNRTQGNNTGGVNKYYVYNVLQIIAPSVFTFIKLTLLYYLVVRFVGAKYLTLQLRRLSINTV